MPTTTLLDSLKAVNAYPVPLPALLSIAARHGLPPDAEATAEALAGKAFNLCVAEVLLWLSLAPDVAQGGQQYSFTDEQRTRLRSKAQAIFGKWSDEGDDAAPTAEYGYKGSRL